MLARMSEQWISSSKAIESLAQRYDDSGRFASYEVSLAVAEDALLHRLANSALRARARYAEMRGGSPLSDKSVRSFTEEVIPSSFWQSLKGSEDSDRSLDWVLGDFSYATGYNEFCESGQAFDVHFDVTALPGGAGISSNSQGTGGTNAGRPARFDWPNAVLKIFGLIYRGDLKPSKQADIERALLDYLSIDDKAPSESTVRPYAKMIWEEYQKG